MFSRRQKNANRTGLSISKRGFNRKKISQVIKHKKLAMTLTLIPLVAIGVVALLSGLAKASGDRYTITIEDPGSLFNKFIANDGTEDFVAYCYDPDTDYDPALPNYISTSATITSAVDELLARAYPAYSAELLSILYDIPNLTDKQAYDATQIAVWKLIKPSYALNPVLGGNSVDLYVELLNNPKTVAADMGIKIDDSTADFTVYSTRTVYGPIQLSVDSGDATLDSIIRSGTISVTPAAAERASDFNVSTSATSTGAEATNITLGTSAYPQSVYINFLSDDGINIDDLTFTYSPAAGNEKVVNDLVAVDVLSPIIGVSQTLIVVKTDPPAVADEMGIHKASTTAQPRLTISKTVSEYLAAKGAGDAAYYDDSGDLINADSKYKYSNNPFSVYEIDESGIGTRIAQTTISGSGNATIPSLEVGKTYVVIEDIRVVPNGELAIEASIGGNQQQEYVIDYSDGELCAKQTNVCNADLGSYASSYYTGVEFTAGDRGTSSSASFYNFNANFPTTPMSFQARKTKNWDVDGTSFSMEIFNYDDNDGSIQSIEASGDARCNFGEIDQTCQYWADGKDTSPYDTWNGEKILVLEGPFQTSTPPSYVPSFTLSGGGSIASRNRYVIESDTARVAVDTDTTFYYGAVISPASGSTITVNNQLAPRVIVDKSWVDLDRMPSLSITKNWDANIEIDQEGAEAIFELYKLDGSELVLDQTETVSLEDHTVTRSARVGFQLDYDEKYVVIEKRLNDHTKDSTLVEWTQGIDAERDGLEWWSSERTYKIESDLLVEADRKVEDYYIGMYVQSMPLVPYDRPATVEIALYEVNDGTDYVEIASENVTADNDVTDLFSDISLIPGMTYAVIEKSLVRADDTIEHGDFMNRFTGGYLATYTAYNTSITATVDPATADHYNGMEFTMGTTNNTVTIRNSAYMDYWYDFEVTNKIDTFSLAFAKVWDSNKGAAESYAGQVGINVLWGRLYKLDSTTDEYDYTGHYAQLYGGGSSIDNLTEGTYIIVEDVPAFLPTDEYSTSNKGYGMNLREPTPTPGFNDLSRIYTAYGQSPWISASSLETTLSEGVRKYAGYKFQVTKDGSEETLVLTNYGIERETTATISATMSVNATKQYIVNGAYQSYFDPIDFKYGRWDNDNMTDTALLGKVETDGASVAVGNGQNEIYSGTKSESLTATCLGSTCEPTPTASSYEVQVGIYEDPASFIAGFATSGSTPVAGVDGLFINSNVNNDIAVQLQGNSSSCGADRSYATYYRTVDPNTRDFVGSWTTTKPATGHYTVGAAVTVGATFASPDCDPTTEANVTFTNSSVTTTAYGADPDYGLALLRKTGYDGKTMSAYLDGAQFLIYNASDDSIVDLNGSGTGDSADIWTANSSNRGLLGQVDGTLNYYTTPLLPVGNYYLIEVSAPSGYANNPNIQWHFAVNDINGVSNPSLTQVRKGAGADLQDSIVNDKLFGLNLYKLDRKQLFTFLVGAEFEIYYKDDNIDAPAHGNPNLAGYTKVDEFVTTDLQPVLLNLPWGWYKILETKAPDGYLLNQTKESAPGVDVYSGPATAAQSSSYTDADIYIMNDKDIIRTGHLDIQKQDEAGNNIGPATFTLYNDANQKLMDIQTDNDGHWLSPQLALGTYKLVETSAPDGYDLYDEPIIFTIEANGQIVYQLVVNTLSPISPDEPIVPGVPDTGDHTKNQTADGIINGVAGTVALLIAAIAGLIIIPRAVRMHRRRFIGFKS